MELELEMVGWDRTAMVCFHTVHEIGVQASGFHFSWCYEGVGEDVRYNLSSFITSQY
jgi:hypothetical protein